jgi:uncharacterized protein YjeT (DUF2065 family)
MPTHVKGDPRVLQKGPGTLSAVDRTARLLGWFSIGLGLVELVAPKSITRTLGTESDAMDTTLRVFGAREIGAGILTLSTEKKFGLWARVLGDALDVAVLSKGLKRTNPMRGNVKIALATVLGITALDIATAWAITARSARPRQLRDYSGRSGYPNGIAQTRTRQVLTAARQQLH